MINEIIGNSILLLLLLFSSNVLSKNFKTTCDLLIFPRECHCQRARISLNETRLRCRQLTEITTDYHWSIVPYDHLTFETLNDNLTLHRSVFADIIVRTLRFNIQHLFLNDHTFDNAYISQLTISHQDHQDTYGRINFELTSQIFYGSMITNLHFKSIDFQTSISELIFSNARIHTFLIHSSKFHGFTNKQVEFLSKTLQPTKYNHFLDYESILPTNLKQLTENSSTELNQTIPKNSPIYIKIYRIISSINTTNLTENYFPNNLDYSQTDEIELRFNQINSLNSHTFRYLKQFKGRLLLINNHIKSIHPSALTDLSLIKYLSLSKNFIQNLTSKHFQELTQLYELDLSFNQIHQLHHYTFEYLNHLHILHLNYNPLEFIHSNAFANLTQLKEVSFQGVQFIHSIDQEYFQWIWNLASLRVIHLLKTDFDLSDVAFCILSHYNQTLFHFSRQHSCSCNIHYFNRNGNSSILTSEYHTNYLRLTPICYDNRVESIFEQQTNENELIFQDLEDQCDYKLIFLDCNAMTTTTTRKTETEIISIHSTTETPAPSTITRTTPKPPSLNNIKKLFTVLATVFAITIGGIILLFFWYRLTGMLKRRKKKKYFIDHQRSCNSSVAQYVSSDTLAKIQCTHLSSSKSLSQVLIESSTALPPIVYKNIETIRSKSLQNVTDDEGLKQDLLDNRTTEMQMNTQY